MPVNLPRSGSGKLESAEFMVLLSHAEVDRKTTSDRARMIRTAASASKAADPVAVKVDSVKFISGSDDLKVAEKYVRQTDFALRLPSDDSVKLVRRGILMCSPYSRGCNFTLLTADSVHSAE